MIFHSMFFHKQLGHLSETEYILRTHFMLHMTI
jgi:hypothetical protein